MGIEDKQNEAKRAFDRARAVRATPPQEREQSKPKPPPKPTLEPKGPLQGMGNAEAKAQMAKSENERIRAALEQKKQERAERSVPTDFNRAR